ncbi:MAG TPA: UvrD-helicase domain-containing protein [Bryobacteraceae bacterium]|nr:UvrD-helicase domain-containing protein [Bryobacteraceae bacterium]
MIADQAAREQALDPARSFIVQAPAGSGKTGLLVQRYLRLLSLVDRPESVVAMTFTRKAAGELLDRIQDALAAAFNDEPIESDHERRTRELASAVLQQDRRLGWNLLLDPTPLQIQTIDSLCALLARQMPVISGFSGTADVVEDATEVYRLAARKALRDLAEGTEVEHSLLARLGLYFDGDFVSLEDQIVRMLAQRDQWRTLEAESDPEVHDFCALLTYAAQALSNVFQEQGAVDFTAITEAAIRVLGSPEQPSDFLYGLDYRIQHLLVDEFQDTSHSQYELINALTAQWSAGDSHTLFLVGDPMQSIYGFRGAEVSLFLKTWNEGQLPSVQLEKLALETNFRTTPQILQWVQEKFAPAMQGDAGGGVEFRPSSAGRAENGEMPELAALIDDKNKTAEAALVTKVSKRSLRLGSVAVLVRSRSHLASILPALREEGILYEAVEIDQLAEQQHVSDLFALTRAILHPADRVAWLACLRAPWCGLSLADLSVLVENEAARVIPELISDPFKMNALSIEGRFQLARAGDVLLAAADNAGRAPLSQVVADTWLLLGGPVVLQRPHQLEDVRTYLNLLEGLEEGGVVRDMSLLALRLESLFARPATGENYVQVMTIHKAKGLEFDTVILPQLAAGSRPSERDLLIWNETIENDGSAQLSIAAQPRRGQKSEHYDAINKARSERETHELKRLFYVACTRARNSLYLVGSVTPKKDGSDVQTPRSNTFLRLIWESVSTDFTAALRRSPSQRSLFAVEAPAPKTILRRLPQSWQLPRFARSVEWESAYQEMTASSRKVTYQWVSDTGRHVGTVVHELLKRPGVAFSDALVRSELLRLGVTPAEEPAATARAMRALQNTLESPRGRWILQEHDDARSEWPLGGKIGEEIVSGTIDRMFRDKEGRLWIIDFKTSDHEGAGLKSFLEREQRRYRGQLENYATLVSQMERGPIWLGLYFPLLDGWREWEYEKSAILTAH